VEQVKELRTELNGEPLCGVRGLQQCHIPVVQAWTVEKATISVTWHPQILLRKNVSREKQLPRRASRVEETDGCAAIVGQVSTRTAAKRPVTALAQGDRYSGSEPSHTRNLPSFKKLVQGAAGRTRQLEQRQLVNIADNEVMGHVK